MFVLISQCTMGAFIVPLIKSVFCANNLTPSIINTNDKVFMSAQCIYSTKNQIYLTLFSSLFTTRESPFLFANIYFFFDKDFF